jgi:broad specificity phosphatase PhoE
MKRLILIKHAPPEVDPTQSSEKWSLGDKGRKACEPLAEKLKPFATAKFISSREPKAVQTAEELAKKLSVEVTTIAGLEEHDRRNVPHMRTGEFISMVELFFRRPDDLVLGDETASEALARISAAIHAIVKDATEDTVAVITHGTVMALFLEKLHVGKSGFELWRRLGLPSFAVLEIPSYKTIEIVERV